jgi:hypothetical protein
MQGPSGYWYIDGIDLFTGFAVAIKKGAALFLQMPERKESISHDWPDQHGLDIDTSKPLFKERTVTLECWLYANDKSEFWQKRNAFVAQLMKPGQRRLTIGAQSGRSYFVIYKSMSSYEQFVTFKLQDGQLVHQFSLTLLEPNPQVDYDDLFLAADNGEFIIV